MKLRREEIKREKRQPKKRTRFSKWLAAPITALSTLVESSGSFLKVGAPIALITAYGGATMAQTKVEPAEKKAGYTTEELTKILDVIQGPETIEVANPANPDVKKEEKVTEHPANAADYRRASDDALKLWHLVNVAEGREAASDPAVADAVNKLKEDKGEDAAIDLLHGNLRISINKMYENKNTLTNANRAEIQGMLQAIEDRSFEDPRYEDLELDIHDKRIWLKDRLGGGTGEPGFAKLELEEPSPIEFRSDELLGYDLVPKDIGFLHPVYSADKVNYQAVYGDVPYDLAALWGGEDNIDTAQGAFESLSRAHAARANGDPQDVGTEDLLSYLEQIKHPQIANNPDFKDALELLRQGKRDEALAKLEQMGGPIETLLNEANKVATVKIHSRALSIYSLGFNLKFDLSKKNYADFINYLKTSGPEDFNFRLLYWGLGFHYNMLLLSGWKDVGSVDASGNFTGTREPISGIGHDYSLEAFTNMAWSVNQVPMQLLLRAQFGVRHYKFAGGPEVTLQSGTRLDEEGTIESIQPYMGILQAELQFPTKGVVKPILPPYGIPSRAGAIYIPGVLSDSEEFEDLDRGNFLVYATWPFHFNLKDGFMIRAMATPEFSRMVGTSRFGWEVEADFLKESTMPWSAGLGYKGEIAVEGTGQGILSSQIYLKAGGQLTPWLRLSGHIGYYREDGGDEAFRLPPKGLVAPFVGESTGGTEGTFFAGIKADVDWGFARDEVSAKAVASKIPQDLAGAPASMYRQAQDFLATAADEDAKKTPQAQQMAKDLAERLEREDKLRGGYSFKKDAANMKFYEDALSELRAGNLEEGVNLLNKIPDFQF